MQMTSPLDSVCQDQSLSKHWNTYPDIHSLLVACIGMDFGPEPEKELASIRLARAKLGKDIVYRMGLGSDDVVAEVGSGCGFVALGVAEIVRKVYCLDISPDFMTLCRNETAATANVECHLVEYADLSVLEGRDVTAVYAIAVFIHFNFYDMYHYMAELGRILKPGGKLYIDIADGEAIDVNSAAVFQSHAGQYLRDRSTLPGLLNFNSVNIFRNLAEQLGWCIIEAYRDTQSSTALLLQKS